MPVDVFPEFAPPLVELQTETPGMSTSEIESLITIQLEDALSSTPHLEVMRSVAVPGLSSTTLIFKPGTDILLARQLVQERLSEAIHRLPAWAGLSWMLAPLSATSRVMHIGITSNEYSLTDLSMITYWTIRYRLMAVPGVANVVIWGEHFKQMQVQIDPQKLQSFQVTIDEVQEVVSDALDFGLLKYTESAKTQVGGFIDTPNQRLGVQFNLPIIQPTDLARVPIGIKTNASGSPLTIGDLGQVIWSHQPLIGHAVIGSEQGILLIVEKFPWANTLDVTQGIDAALAELKPGLPKIKFDATIFRPANFIKMAIDNLTRSLIIACILVMCVLGAFLYEWRTMLISMVAIPLSLIAAGLVLNFFNASINTLILAGFVIAIGGVVDDAIIDVENIVRRLRQAHQEKSKQSLSSIILEASLEIRGAIIFAVLIDVVVLLPIFFLGGVSGAFFKPLAIAYILALLASMVVALTLTPVLCLVLLKNAPMERRESPLLRWLKRGYDRSQTWIIEKPKLVFLVIISLILIGLLTLPFLGASLFPAFKERDFLMHWVTKPATSGEEVIRMTKLVSRELRAIPGVLSFGSHIGRALMGEELHGINFAENWIHVDSSVDYATTVDAVEKVVNGYPGLFHDVQTYLNERIDEVIAGSTSPVVVRIFGQDLNTLRELAEKVRASLSKIEGAVDVHAQFQIDIPHIQVEVNIAKANEYGLKPGDIRRAASTFIAGTEVSDIHRDAKVYDIVVWGTPDTRSSVESVRNLLISTPTGGTVKLSEVANVSILPTPNLIERENNSRRIDVGLDTKNRVLSEIVADVKTNLQAIPFPLGYHAEVLGEFAERQTAERLLLVIGIAAAIAVLLLLQTAFGNWRLALLAFFSLPSALVGGILAAFLTGGVISLGSLVGFFTVFGIAARNGILLINHYQYIEQHEGEHFGPGLILRGAKERLAPILMTALAAGLALVPLVIFGDIPGQEIEYPMAIVILGGLFSSTVLNLFLMPYLYLRFGKATPRIDKL